MDLSWLSAGARDLDAAASELPQESFGQLGARTVMGAEKEHAQWPVRIPAGGRRLVFENVDQRKCIACCDKQCLQPVEIKAVVNIASILTTPPVAHQPQDTQLLEVVGDHVERQVKPLNNFPYPQIGVRQKTDYREACFVSTRFEELYDRRWRRYGGEISRHTVSHKMIQIKLNQIMLKEYNRFRGCCGKKRAFHCQGDERLFTRRGTAQAAGLVARTKVLAKRPTTSAAI